MISNFKIYCSIIYIEETVQRIESYHAIIGNRVLGGTLDFGRSHRRPVLRMHFQGAGPLSSWVFICTFILMSSSRAVCEFKLGCRNSGVSDHNSETPENRFSSFILFN